MIMSPRANHLLVQHTADVAVPFDVASDRMQRHLDMLLADVHGALEYGESIRTRLGAGGNQFHIEKSVNMTIGTPLELTDRLVVPLWWEATGPQSLFPRMDADLILTDRESYGSDLTFRGQYSPPLGPLGELIDRLMLHRLADATGRQFVEAAARALAGS